MICSSARAAWSGRGKFRRGVSGSDDDAKIARALDGAIHCGEMAGLDEFAEAFLGGECEGVDVGEEEGAAGAATDEGRAFGGDDLVAEEGVAEDGEVDERGGMGGAIEGEEGTFGAAAPTVDGAGEHAFADAGLANDQDGVGGGCNFSGLCDGCLLGFGGGGEIGVGGGGATGVGREADGRFKLIQFRGTGDGGRKLVGGEGLAEEIRGAAGHGAHGDIHRGKGGDDDEFHAWLEGCELCDEVEAVGGAKADIKEHDVERSLLNGGKSGFGGIRFLDVVAEGFETNGHGAGNGVLVIDDQNVEEGVRLGRRCRKVRSILEGHWQCAPNAVGAIT